MVEKSEIRERLREIRRQKGFSAKDVAEKLGFKTHKTIIDLESGRRGLSDDEFEALKSLYGVSDNEFYQEDELSLLLRSENNKFDEDTRESLKKILPNLELFLKLKSWVKTSNSFSSWDLVSRSFSRLPKSQEEAINQGERLAQSLRDGLRLGDDPIDDIFFVLECLGIQLIGLKMGSHVSGFFLCSSRTGPVIFVNVDERRERRVFSIAHELCHFLLDNNPNTRSINITQSIEVFKDKYDKDFQEMRANAFAAAFLMPETGVKRYIVDVLGKDLKSLNHFDVVKIQHCFRTSFQATLFRLKNLGFITARFFRETKEMINVGQISVSQLASSLDLSYDAYPDIDSNKMFSSLLKKFAVDAYMNSKISISKLCEIFERNVIEQKDLLKELQILPSVWNDSGRDNPLLR